MSVGIGEHPIGWNALTVLMFTPKSVESLESEAVDTVECVELRGQNLDSSSG